MSIPHKCRAGPELQSPAPGRHAPHSAVSKPILHLQTLFLVDDDGRISGTRKPEPSRGPLFSLIRGKASEIPDRRRQLLRCSEEGHVVSVCFCARRFNTAAEELGCCERNGNGRFVGVDSFTSFAGWALAVRASGRTPLYSTSWSNDASLAVARKLGLVAYASAWSISSGR